MKNSCFSIRHSLLVTFCLFFINSESATIVGVLKNEKQEPIVKQKVWLNEDRSYLTDKNGVFRFDKIPKGIYQLSIKIGTENIILKSITIQS